ncbi:unnamed protein product [Allacma fusca]|uniref:Ionotropic glutamate receptor n=1 Tax=Allacma fusca TaxID=39272 RepID=A0A8J2K8F9_9HEXA|nr:unnamed protein product [Allacma fusca]
MGVFVVRASQTDLILQLAPSVTHQAHAMLTLLSRYNWHQFAIVTSQIAGHDDFVQAVRDRVLESEFKFIILTTAMVVAENDLQFLVGSEARILLLYCTREEAKTIFGYATKLGLTGANYVWVATQSVIGDSLDAPTFSTNPNAPPESAFPVGMLGVHFNTSYESLKTEIFSGLRVFSQGVEAFYTDPINKGVNLSTSLSCEGLGETAKWAVGDRFFRYLKNVSIEFDSGSSKPPLKFNQENTLQFVELQIMNLRPGATDRQLVWEQIGVWQSWKDQNSQLDIKDIIWPGYSHKPPDGVPEKFHLKVAFLEEPPFIKMADPDPVTGKCSPDRGVICRIAPETESIGCGEISVRVYFTGSLILYALNHSEVVRNSSFYQCCSGFCIDLLVKFAENIGFTYELARVQDAKWGSQHNGKWNGLISELINRKVDVALASLMINSEREGVVDFSVPFMDSGVAILTAKRTGIISPTAFLEPFDPALWMLVCLVGIQVYSLAIFLFEWLSPMGFDMKVPGTMLSIGRGGENTNCFCILIQIHTCPLSSCVLEPDLLCKEAKPGARFSFFRSCWLVWARLFQASVHIDPPRGFTANVQ